MEPPPITDYHCGWICALSYELAAARAMLDVQYDMVVDKDPEDSNTYVLGRMQNHNIVIACLPAGDEGTEAAATVASNMVRTFTAIRFGFLVGVGAGVPDFGNGDDIHLGDIVVSKSRGTSPGVVQYDKGKSHTGGHFELKGSLSPPPRVLLTALSVLQAEHEMNNPLSASHMEEALNKNPRMVHLGYGHPGQEKDILHCDNCIPAVESCQTYKLGIVTRTERTSATFSIHYGTIASGNQDISDASTRNKIKQLTQAICIEKEAAGLMNNFPCLVIRGICDYADAFKTNTWCRYAAISAAAYTKELLLHVNHNAVKREKPVHEIIEILHEHQQIAADHLKAATAHYDRYAAADAKIDAWREYEERKKCHQAFKTSNYEEFKNFNPDRDSGTCLWVLQHEKYREWLNCKTDTLLWISADPGCGKSVLAKSLLQKELRSRKDHTACHFFFKDNLDQERLGTALCAVLHQLFASQKDLLAHAMPFWQKNGKTIREEVTELWQILLAASADPRAQDITIVFDALDECRDRDRERLIELLTKFYTTASTTTLDSSKTSKIKFLVTSRPYSDIQTGFNGIPSDLPSIRLLGEKEDEQLGKEINMVIERKVVKVADDLKLAPTVTKRIRDQLLGMKNRTYLWLQLVIGTIYQTYRSSLRPEEEEFEVLPTTVESAYEKILNKVSEKSRDIVKKILLIIVGARRALTVAEMAIALGVSTTSPDIPLQKVRLDPNLLELRLSDWSGLFVSISNGLIYLIHQTAREFLIDKEADVAKPQSWKYCLNEPEVENTMTEICVNYLELHNEFLANNPSITGLDVHNQRLQPDSSREEPRVRDDVSLYDGDEGDNASVLYKVYPEGDFFSYATQSWRLHLEGSQLRENDNLMSRLFQLHDIRSSAMCQYTYWYGHPRDIIGIDDSDESTATKWHGVIASGSSDLLRWMLKQENYKDINITDAKGNTPLILASCFDRKDMVEILFKNGADINFPCTSYKTALAAAHDMGHADVEDFLLANGAIAETSDFPTRAFMLEREMNDLVERLFVRTENGLRMNAKPLYP